MKFFPPKEKREFALSFIADKVSRRTRELGYSIIRCFNSPTLVQDMEPG